MSKFLEKLFGIEDFIICERLNEILNGLMFLFLRWSVGRDLLGEDLMETSFLLLFVVENTMSESASLVPLVPLFLVFLGSICTEFCESGLEGERHKLFCTLPNWK